MTPTPSPDVFDWLLSQPMKTPKESSAPAIKDRQEQGQRRLADAIADLLKREG